jgi:hypothetical protein
MFVEFPSIEHLKHITRGISKSGIDEITFTGKVKLHGTNAAVGYDRLSDTFWVQSRKRVITPEDDNYGFATWVSQHQDSWLSNLRFLSEALSADRLVVFGEWAGKGINQGASICNLANKNFFVIEVYILDQDSNFVCGPLQAVNLPIKNTSLEGSVHHIHNFQLFSLTGNFTSEENYKQFAETVETLTLDVENNCPVASEFGVNGTGEGIVWTSHCGKFRFKSKGPKHSTVDRKIKPPKDPAFEIRLNELLRSVVTDARIHQAISEVAQGEASSKHIGSLIKWVVNDVLKEDSDVIAEFGFEVKDFTKAAGSKLGKLFREKYDA